MNFPLEIEREKRKRSNVLDKTASAKCVCDVPRNDTISRRNDEEKKTKGGNLEKSRGLIEPQREIRRQLNSRFVERSGVEKTYFDFVHFSAFQLSLTEFIRRFLFLLSFSWCSIKKLIITYETHGSTEAR